MMAQYFVACKNNKAPQTTATDTGTAASINHEADFWLPKNINLITDSNLKKIVLYGQQLITHTAAYYGPRGSIARRANGLNCQNCHLRAGTAIYGNNFGSAASLYPKFRARSGTVENLQQRVNECFMRSLNGKALDTASTEMHAIIAYINYIGSNVPKGKKANGSGFKDLPLLNVAASPQKGFLVYTARCSQCHQPGGDGLLNNTKNEYTFPALWGNNSFNDGAGLYRISSLAKFIKYNMPLGVTYNHTVLSDEEAWNVAAFICGQPRPHMDTRHDWPDISKKPVDYPFGPYKDTFTETVHKYGPFINMMPKN